jgi:Cu/Ag efflux protein CusF
MKIRNLVAPAFVLAWAFAPLAAAQEKKPLEASDVQSITATVEAVDSSRREVTLKGPKGNVVVISVPESVKRFPEIKVGDLVNVKYMESVVIAVKEADPAAKLGTTTDTKMKRSEGEKPGGAVARQTTATVAVESVDPATPSLTVRKADGGIASYRVQDAKNLAGVKPGDHIVVTYTEALAVQVSAPKK